MNRVYKKTKILATVGPVSSTPKMIAALLSSGSNCFRLNLSHAGHAEHAAVIRAVRSLGKKHGIYPGILADLQGPKIRTGLTPDNRPVLLRKGATVALTPRTAVCTADIIFVDYPALLKDVRLRQHILINDGAVALRVSAIDKKNNRVICSVLNTGSFSSRKGVNFPDTDLRIDALTAKDRRDLQGPARERGVQRFPGLHLAPGSGPLPVRLPARAGHDPSGRGGARALAAAGQSFPVIWP